MITASSLDFTEQGSVLFSGRETGLVFEARGATASVKGRDASESFTCNRNPDDTIQCAHPVVGAMFYDRAIPSVAAQSSSRPPKYREKKDTWFDKATAAQIVEARRGFDTARSSLVSDYLTAMGEYAEAPEFSDSSQVAAWRAEYEKRGGPERKGRRDKSLEATTVTLLQATNDIIRQFFQREAQEARISREDLLRFEVFTKYGTPVPDPNPLRYTALMRPYDPAYVAVFEEVVGLWTQTADPAFTVDRLSFRARGVDFYRGLGVARVPRTKFEID